jgi:pimeloyl-ACP methyl ester carboxylesterase
MRYIPALLLLLLSAPAAAGDDAITEGFADSAGVKIHYVTQGRGPLVVMIHGFPDYWYTWRAQMPALAKHFQVVAIDQRGYNKSDQPKGVESYTVEKLVADVQAVADHFKQSRITVVGHDWGGLVAWSYAMKHPDKLDRLVILNLPHPKGIERELARNPEQQKASAYARALQASGSELLLTPERLAFWVKEPEDRKKYVEALKRSSMEGMANYYRANYPREPYKEERVFPTVKCPVLLIHGLDDPYLLSGALDGTWKWIEKDLTLITVPGAGHFVHRDAPDFVNKKMVRWLTEER